MSVDLVEVLVTKPGRRVPYGVTFHDAQMAMQFAKLCLGAGLKPEVSPIFGTQMSAGEAFAEVSKYFEEQSK